MTLPEQAVILLAEDLPNDILLIRRALDNAGVKNPFFIVPDGEEALAYLNGVGKYSNRDEYPLPDILLLDLKMPKMDGFEVLRAVRKSKSFSALRIIVLTSSEDIRDVNRAYELGANSFLVKPLEFENFKSMMQTLSAFWLRTSKTPMLDRPARAGNHAPGPPGHRK
jgi:CheY-like chemotaxis protein